MYIMNTNNSLYWPNWRCWYRFWFYRYQYQAYLNWYLAIGISNYRLYRLLILKMGAGWPYCNYLDLFILFAIWLGKGRHNSNSLFPTTKLITVVAKAKKKSRAPGFLWLLISHGPLLFQTPSVSSGNEVKFPCNVVEFAGDYFW